MFRAAAFSACRMGALGSTSAITVISKPTRQLVQYFAEKTARTRPGWQLKFVALSIFTPKPLSMAFYLLDDTVIALISFTLPTAGGAIFLGPTLSHAYSRIQPIDRRLMTAVFTYCINLIGLGLGPALVGLMSGGLADQLLPRNHQHR